jgi:hypothetical protein
MNYKYLISPADFSIWELDENNNCYYSLNLNSTRNKRLNFTFKNLTKNHGFFTIDEAELISYKLKSDNYLFNNFID